MRTKQQCQVQLREHMDILEYLQDPDHHDMPEAIRRLPVHRRVEVFANAETIIAFEKISAYTILWVLDDDVPDLNELLKGL